LLESNKNLRNSEVRKRNAQNFVQDLTVELEDRKSRMRELKMVEEQRRQEQNIELNRLRR
jgi:CRISPR/Cas system CSM-associated protein Csm5 (group 7 of RAMP superfamily)